MLRFTSKFFVIVLLLVIMPLVSACTTNPATGRSSFTGLMPLDKEKEIGKQGFTEITSEPNSVYRHKKLQDFVSDIGQRLARHSERKDIEYTFTVLNSEDVNAFAMPGGYIFITRGLLAVANSEAEVAAVLAHEMAHVTARHSAQQYSHSVVTGIGATLLGALAKNSAVSNIANTSGALYLRAYSREHEHEADALGVRYLEAEGYDPYAMANFLSSLLESTKLQAKLAGGNENGVDGIDYFSTHPTTQSRIEDVTQLAMATIQDKKPYMNGIERYMTAVDGMAYGASEDKGYIRGQDFIHVPMNFRFTAPDGFNLINSDEMVMAKDKQGNILVFDIDKSDTPYASPMQYMQKGWFPLTPFSQIKAVMVDRKSAAMALAAVELKGKIRPIWIGAVQKSSNEFYRFYLISNSSGSENVFKTPFYNTVQSFRNLTPREKDTILPYTLDIKTVGADNSVKSMAKKMAVYRYPLEHFMVINGIRNPDEFLKVGSKVKIIK